MLCNILADSAFVTLRMQKVQLRGSSGTAELSARDEDPVRFSSVHHVATPLPHPPTHPIGAYLVAQAAEGTFPCLKYSR